MTKCEPPKCSRVADRCQCPNPWIEHLASEAAERKRKGLPRLSIRQHAKRYRQAVQAGKYLLRKADKHKTCRGNDVDLLCSMNATRADKSSISRAPLTLPLTFEHDFLTLRSKHLKKFNDKDMYLARYKGHDLVVKWNFRLKDEYSRRDFMYQAYVHKEAHKRMPANSPKLWKAYVIRKEHELIGVHIMDRLPGITLDEFLRTKKFTRSEDMMLEAAVQLKKMFELMTKSKIWHGDLNPHNIIVETDRDGMMRNASIIDFGNVVIDVPIDNNDNMIDFLNIDNLEELTQKFIPYFKRLGATIPDDIENWGSDDFEDNTPYAGVQSKVVGNLRRDPDVDLEIVIS